MKLVELHVNTCSQSVFNYSMIQCRNIHVFPNVVSQVQVENVCKLISPNSTHFVLFSAGKLPPRTQQRLG